MELAICAWAHGICTVASGPNIRTSGSTSKKGPEGDFSLKVSFPSSVFFSSFILLLLLLLLLQVRTSVPTEVPPRKVQQVSSSSFFFSFSFVCLKKICHGFSCNNLLLTPSQLQPVHFLSEKCLRTNRTIF